VGAWTVAGLEGVAWLTKLHELNDYMSYTSYIGYICYKGYKGNGSGSGLGNMTRARCFRHEFAFGGIDATVSGLSKGRIYETNEGGASSETGRGLANCRKRCAGTGSEAGSDQS
jgi:hypothetical protein